MKILIKTIGLLLLTTSALAQPTKKITVILDWFVNPDHAPLIVAEQQGYFNQQGLEVNIIAPANPNDGPKLVAAGKADITISYQAALLQQVDQGLPLMRVGTLLPNNLNAIAVLKNGPIKTIADLKGKKIGMSVSGIDQTMLAVVLEHNGIKAKDVTMIDVNYNLVQALLTHRVDAITDIMRNVEPIEMKMLGHPVRLFLPENYGVPESDAEIWIVNNAEANKPWVNKFLLAIAQGTQYLRMHPQETWQRFAKSYPAANTTFNEKSWMATYKLFAVDPHAYNKMKYQKFAEFIYERKLITKVPPLSLYVK